jgi:hypothetical protein
VTAPAIVWIAVGLVSTAAIVAVLVGLIRQMIALGRTLSRFQEQVSPLAEEISAGADRASTRMSDLQAADAKRRR